MLSQRLESLRFEAHEKLPLREHEVRGQYGEASRATAEALVERIARYANGGSPSAV